MTARPPVLLAVLVCLVLAGCSSHERRYEGDVPAGPQREDPIGADRYAAAAGTIVLHYRDSAEVLSTTDLAYLTEAAAVTYRATSAPGVRLAATRYADLLVSARRKTKAGIAFGSGTGDGVDPATTALAVNGLVQAYKVTGSQRYRTVAAKAAKTLASPSLGTRPGAGGLVVGAAGRPAVVALTALVSRALRQAGGEGIDAGTTPAANRMEAAISKAEIAGGHWYADFSGKVPMDMEQWAMTLLSEVTSRNPRATQVAFSGVPAFGRAAFDRDGDPRLKTLPDDSGRGTALALSVFIGLDPTHLGPVVAERAFASRRQDGTVDRAPATAADVQALYAIGFAGRSLTLTAQAS